MVKQADSGTYLYTDQCNICRNAIHITIPQGMKPDEYYKENPKCPECKCDMV